MSCPQTMILQDQPKLQLLRRRAWDKSPVALTRLTTCNRVNTTNPEYKNTQQDLTGWKLSFPTLKGMQAFKEVQGINCRFLSNSTKEGGVLYQSAKQLQLTSFWVLTFRFLNTNCNIFYLSMFEKL